MSPSTVKDAGSCTYPSNAFGPASVHAFGTSAMSSTSTTSAPCRRSGVRDVGDQFGDAGHQIAGHGFPLGVRHAGEAG